MKWLAGAEKAYAAIPSTVVAGGVVWLAAHIGHPVSPPWAIGFVGAVNGVVTFLIPNSEPQGSGT
jgi:hypothetical protein